MGANFYRTRDTPGFRLGHYLNLGFVVLGGSAIVGIYWSYGRENEARERRCAELVEGLERRVKAEKAEEEELRRAFLVEKEESLAHEGDRSVWFRYTL